MAGFEVIDDAGHCWRQCWDGIGLPGGFGFGWHYNGMDAGRKGSSGFPVRRPFAVRRHSLPKAAAAFVPIARFAGCHSLNRARSLTGT
ncbi:hypothetical protein KCP78_19280 [Salmonella enterica subsp. enterica]|nr:hypothetical protein KCP78_19280 [Salmonella enterica subsp. enterica]